METFQSIQKLFTPNVEEQNAREEAEKKCLLIVDDNPDFLGNVSGILGQTYRISVAHSATEALEKLADDPEAVLLDVKMADMDGLELFEALRSKRPDLPIIFNTAYPGGSDKLEKLKSLPHAGCLIKGEYNEPELLKLLRETA